MKRIIVFISMLLCLSVIADDKIGQCPWPPHGGDNNPPRQYEPRTYPSHEAHPDGYTSVDPNEIIGPIGYDSVRWISINDMLNYTILFENDPLFATAAAQKVDVRFSFPNKAWIKGFGIGNYCFSNMSFSVGKPSNAYQQRIDLKDSLGIYVDLIGGLDVAKQQGFWTFTTIDPETGYAPWQAEKGLLPVNDSTHVGEGFVTFQLKPYEGLKTGDTISIQANIVFDQNDTIPTNRWCNKIDAGMPESKVKVAPLSSPEGETPTAYQLTFTGHDDEGGSGVKHLLLYLANHNGIYEEIDTVAVDSTITFPVEKGKQYKLYSIAVDNTGNREPAKMEPDVILNFNQAPTDIALSDTIFKDDLAAGGFVGRLTSVDSEDETTFTYALADGDGAIHNDLFQISEDQLQIKNSFKCAKDSIYKVRVSTTDEGGMTFSKAFTLRLLNVLDKPKADTLAVTICEGETCLFHGKEYDKTGFFTYTQSNDYMCDSIYVLNLSVVKPLEMPLVTIEGTHTLVSSAAKGNQWFYEDGTPVEGATEQKFTPTEDGIYYVAATNGSCYSEPSQAYQVKLSDNLDLQLDLKAGWNWMSSSLSEPANQDAKQFLQPIKDITERFVGQTNELVNDPIHGLTGGLSSIAPVESYRLKVSEGIINTWRGNGVNPENTTLTLHKGWNWIGYVPLLSSDLSTSFAGVSPSENDVVKCLDDFATFTNGKWIGTLTKMKPGEGYMYYAANAQSFKYPALHVVPVTTESRTLISSSNDGPWDYDAHRYADNKTMIVRLLANGEQTLGGAFTVGAFCGNECRGIGKYVDDMLFLTVHGSLSDASKISFKVYENATGQEFGVVETVQFDGEQQGTYKNPFVMHVNIPMGIDASSDMSYSIYPRPLRSRMYVNGDVSKIKTIQILSSNGVVNIRQDGYNDDGVDVSSLQSGVYVVAITLANGKVYYEKVIKV